MNKISFKIIPNQEDNDHEVRIFIDDVDWLTSDKLGVDPPEFFERLTKGRTDQLLVGRCGCGIVGCDDVFVSVTRDNECVRWQMLHSQILEFDRIDYDLKTTELITDTSWEDIKRRLERLIEKQFAGTVTHDGFVFKWVSARIKENAIHHSYSNGPEQRLLRFSWDGITEKSALESARTFKSEMFA